MGVAGHAEDDLLGDDLDRLGQVHLSLGDLGLRGAGRPVEQLGKAVVGHGEAVEIAEVREVEPEGPILADVEQMVINRLHVHRFPVGRQPHELVFARVDFEAREIGERRIEQPERVGEAHLLEDGEFVVRAVADGAGGPLADTVDGEDGGALEGGGIERAGGVRLVVLREVDVLRHVDARLVERGLHLQGDPQFLPHPEGNGHHEGGEALGGDAEVGLENAGELGDGLVVERDGVEPVGFHVAFGEAVLHRVDGEIGIVFLPGEALFLGGGHDVAVADEGGRGVVVVRADPEDVHQCWLR